MIKESFLLKTSWINIFNNISDKQAGMLIKALYHYNCTDIAEGDISVTLSDVEVKAYFNIMVLDCIKFQENYDRRCETSRENGRLGGRPKSSEIEKPKKPNSKPKKPNNLTKPENENENENENDFNTASSCEDALSGDIPPDNPKNHEIIDYKKFIEWFNRITAGVFGILQYPLGEKRKTMMKARIREHGKENFFVVIEKSIKSDFMKGQSGKNFTATFDWIIRPTNFEKILSGNYDNK